MPRALTHAQLLQNAAFLEGLRKTGNASHAARELGVARTTFTNRRAKHTAFAAEWDATLAAAHAAFRLSGGARMPEGEAAADPASLAIADAPEWQPALRIKGGEPTIVRMPSGSRGGAWRIRGGCWGARGVGCLAGGGSGKGGGAGLRKVRAPQHAVSP